MVQTRAFDASYKIDDTYHRYVMGKDINRYVIMPLEERWISYGGWLAAPREASSFFTSRKILVRQTSDSIIATMDEHQYLHLNNIHNVHVRQSKNNYSILFILATLNAKLLTFYHQQIVPEMGRVFAEVKIIDLERIPIRLISFTTPARDRARLLEEGKGHYAAYLSASNPGALLAFTGAQLAAEPERSDVVHDLLAFLAEQMIGLNKEKQAEIRGFLTWLERAISAKIDVLTNKTKLRAYHEYDLDTLLEVLNANRRKLTVNPNDRRFQENLEREYTRSRAVLTPLKAQIAATDRLIDQVVYQLYGLTEEEIRIVEGVGDATAEQGDSAEGN
jgi:hypothetical protein